MYFTDICKKLQNYRRIALFHLLRKRLMSCRTISYLLNLPDSVRQVIFPIVSIYL